MPRDSIFDPEGTQTEHSGDPFIWCFMEESPATCRWFMRPMSLPVREKADLAGQGRLLG